MITCTDLGKLLLGFSCFWMYIWFSQYMLIWYSNIPEETSYFITRTHGPWGPIVIVSIVLNWVLPFFVLLPKPAKRSSGIMLKVAIVVLIGRWVDLYVMVFPATLGENPVFGIWEVASICCLFGAAGVLAVAVLCRRGSRPAQRSLPDRKPALPRRVVFPRTRFPNRGISEIVVVDILFRKDDDVAEDDVVPCDRLLAEPAGREGCFAGGELAGREGFGHVDGKIAEVDRIP